MQPTAVDLLWLLGFRGEPPDPRIEFGDLQGSDQINPAWQSGAVQPVSVGGLAQLLIDACSQNALQTLALILHQAAQNDAPGSRPSRHQAALDLSRVAMPELDKYLKKPLVLVNPAASQRQIDKSIRPLLAQWKDERGLTEQRDRSDKHADYLKAWDLREGWEHGTYYREHELRFREIAKKLKKSISTVSNYYRSAFELITSHEYSPKRWLQMMGVHKFSAVLGEEVGRVSRRRPQKSPSSTPAPASKLGGAEDTPWVTSMAISADGAEVTELVMDVMSMLERGASDEEILEGLEISEAILEGIQYLRTRHGDQPS